MKYYISIEDQETGAKISPIEKEFNNEPSLRRIKKVVKEELKRLAPHLIRVNWVNAEDNLSKSILYKYE